MKHKYYLFLIMILFLITPNLVNADKCDPEDRSRITALSKNVTVDYKYVGDDESYFDYQLYEVNFIGLNEDLYAKVLNERKKIYNDDEKLYVDSGTTTFGIYSYYCADELLNTITVTLPKFNTYSTYEECKNINNRELEVCDKWYQGKLTEKQFQKIINEYQESIESKKWTIQKIIKNYWYLIPITIIIIISLIIIIIYRRNKNKLD